MKSKLKIGVIGLGCRGSSLLEAVMLPMKDIEVAVVCDRYEDRREAAAAKAQELRGTRPDVTGDWREVVAREDLDAVINCTSWADHIPISAAAMRAGKYVGCEVGGAYSIEECWELVRAYEETGAPCMLLENCCYGRDELMVLNMVRQGVFGEVVHCSGGYRHDLRDEVSFGRENRHYRLDNYLNRNCENYPTHELGPIAKVLNLGHGNRMTTLVSMASKAAGLHEYLMREKGAGYDLSARQFAQGDVVSTIIQCAHGQTITLTLDTTLPRPYSRGFHVQGTKAAYEEDNHSLFLDTVHNEFDFKWKEQWGNAGQYREQYEHPIWKQYLADGVRGGHDGMDWLVFRAFFESAKAGTDVPIDVYDMASWMSVSVLTEQSIAAGGMPVAIPDFTRGRWITNPPASEGAYRTAETINP